MCVPRCSLGYGLCLVGIYTAAAAKSLQSCPTLCDPIDSSPPGSPAPGILQARTLEWVAISFSNAWKWKSESEVAQSCRTLNDPMDCSPPGSSNPWDFPGKSTGVGCHCLLQAIYELHLKKQRHYCCVMAVSDGSATEERIEHVYCYSCCVSQERINVSAIPTASRVSFQPLSSRLAYPGFGKQCRQC